MYRMYKDIYASTLQCFSKTLVAEVYIEIHILQTKELAWARQVKTVKDIALQRKQKSRIVIILNMPLVGWQFISFFSVCCIFSLIKHERVRTFVLISQFSTKFYAIGYRLFFKNCYSYLRVTFS